MKRGARPRRRSSLQGYVSVSMAFSFTTASGHSEPYGGNDTIPDGSMQEENECGRHTQFAMEPDTSADARWPSCGVHQQGATSRRTVSGGTRSRVTQSPHCDIGHAGARPSHAVSSAPQSRICDHPRTCINPQVAFAGRPTARRRPPAPPPLTREQTNQKRLSKAAFFFWLAFFASFFSVALLTRRRM